MAKQIIRFGSRDSALAVAQTRLVMDAVANAHPELELELVTMKTTGDLVLDKALDKIGGKGLFVKELDRALRDGRVDYTVHSLKDMPAQTPDDLPLVAFFRRGDPRDALVLPPGRTEPDPALSLGCGSARRVLQLERLYPGLTTKLIRGNVVSRLAKLDAGQYAGLILASAGLSRLGLEGRVSRVFTAEEMIPAAGQGILAVQCLADADKAPVACADDPEARCAALAERAFVRVLDGGCSSPIAAYARMAGGELHLTGLYYSERSGRHCKGEMSGPPEQPERLGERLAGALRTELGD